MRVISLGCTKIWPHPHSLWCWGWVPISLPSQDILGGYWQVRGLPHHYAPRPRPRLPREFTCKYEISLCKTRDSSGMRNRAGDKPNLGTIQDFILCKPAQYPLQEHCMHCSPLIFFKRKRILYLFWYLKLHLVDPPRPRSGSSWPLPPSCSVWCWHWTEDW